MSLSLHLQVILFTDQAPDRHMLLLQTRLSTAPSHMKKKLADVLFLTYDMGTERVPSSNVEVVYLIGHSTNIANTYARA